ncbi:hypothetical protein MDA_GLEAN10009754 [Myotis davidii]|uniref:Uncharacterized protein n=1 Tax=Myotis davidii TaxID=225400 RepID=L5LS15_MYODS|nr:hypothetical protein MDA_GLEAN10009754 [Myotis davidii]
MGELLKPGEEVAMGDCRGDISSEETVKSGNPDADDRVQWTEHCEAITPVLSTPTNPELFCPSTGLGTELVEQEHSGGGKDNANKTACRSAHKHCLTLLERRSEDNLEMRFFSK